MSSHNMITTTQQASTHQELPVILGASEDKDHKRKPMRAMSTLFASPLFDQVAGEKLNQNYVVACLYFKAPLDLQETKNLMRDRLCQIARFRSKAVNISDEGERPVLAFERLGDADIDDLIPDLVQDKTGIVRSQVDIDQLVSEVSCAKLDVHLPLWRVYICNNMSDGRSVLLLIIDHSIADGVALVQTLMSVVDDKPDLPVPSKSQTRQPSGCVTQLKGLIQACWGPLVSEQLADPQNKLKICDPRNPGNKKAMCSTRDISLTRVKEVKNKLPGATVNDVLMTLFALTLQDYFKKYEPSTLKQKVRATFPINLRHVTDGEIVTDEHYGNRFSLGQVRFPLHLEDPVAMFANIKSQLDITKVSPEPSVKKCLTDFVSLKSGMPFGSLADLVLDGTAKVTAMLSNVPGPLTKVRLMGQELDDLNFHAVTGFGLYFGIVQYNGRFKGGICCDASLEPDPKKLADCWMPSFERLYAAVMAQ